MVTENKNKFAVVTGGSSGIGFQLAKQCLEGGFDVMICAEDSSVEVAASKLGSTGGRVQPVQGDLSTYEGVEKLYVAIRATARPVDALLLNAGVGVGGAFTDTPLEAELKMIALNCVHTIHLAKRILPDMVQRGSGRVLITGSVASTAPNPYQAIYGATKAFVMSFGEALREELKETGVTVTVVQPGATDTHFFQRAGLLNTKVGKAKKDDPALVAKQAFTAMLAGKDAVLAGSFRSRVEGFMNELLPERLKASQTGKTTKPLS